MVDVKALPSREYINVMELLVAEEVEQQLRQLPTRVLKYVKPIDVETYALNRLPSLYAVSEKGWRSQYQKAKHEQLRKDISNAVRQAIAAVQIDPLRASRPLVWDHSIANDNSALLEQFRSALGQPNLTWESLLRKCKRARAANRETRQNRSPSTSLSSGNPRAIASSCTDNTSERHHHPSDHHGTAWRPGTYGKTSWHPKKRTAPNCHTPSSSSSSFGYDWTDARHR